MKTTGLICHGLALAAVAFLGCTKTAPPPPTETTTATTAAPGPSFSLGEFEGPRARLHGTVLINGEPAREHYVAIWWKGNGIGPLSLPTAPVTGDGRYDFGVIPAGEMILHVNSGTSYDVKHPSLFASDAIDLQDGKERIENIAFRTGTVSGRVLIAEDGSVAKGATVFMSLWNDGKRRLSDGSWIRPSKKSLADELGRFEFDSLVHGEWRFSVFYPVHLTGAQYKPPTYRKILSIGETVSQVKDHPSWSQDPDQETIQISVEFD